MRELDAGDKIGDVDTALENLKAWDINNRALLRPFLYAGSFAQEADAGKPVYRRELPVRLFDNLTGPALIQDSPGDGYTNTSKSLNIIGRNYAHNSISTSSATWDRWRNNTEGEILSSAVRTVTTNTPDQTNFNARGIILVLTITVDADPETLTLKLQHKLQDGTYVEVATTSADPDTGQHIIVSYPSGQADTYAETFQQELHIDNPLPRTWRAVITHSASGNWTYTVEVMYLL